MKFRSLLLLLSLTAMPGCVETPESQSVRIRFNVKTSYGSFNSYDKIISSGDLINVTSIGLYECRVELDGIKYRMAFWSSHHLHPPLLVIDIRYELGTIFGNGLVMKGNGFSIYRTDVESSMTMDIFSTQFLNSQKEKFKNFYRDNLDCHILTR